MECADNRRTLAVCVVTDFRRNRDTVDSGPILMDSIDDLLQRVFQLPHFRPHQREIIQDVLDGSDVVCVMPTGAGKSLCFQLPALLLKGLTVVVSPLISLMADQVNQLQTAECSRAVDE